MIPTKCHLWNKEEITEDDLDFEQVKSYCDTSHYSVSLQKCRQCDQLYVKSDSEYTMGDGPDMNSTTFFPVSEKELESIDFVKGWSDKRISNFKPVLEWYPWGRIGWEK